MNPLTSFQFIFRIVLHVNFWSTHWVVAKWLKNNSYKISWKSRENWLSNQQKLPLSLDQPPPKDHNHDKTIYFSHIIRIRLKWKSVFSCTKNLSFLFQLNPLFHFEYNYLIVFHPLKRVVPWRACHTLAITVNDRVTHGKILKIIENAMAIDGLSWSRTIV